MTEVHTLQPGDETLVIGNDEDGWLIVFHLSDGRFFTHEFSVPSEQMAVTHAELFQVFGAFTISDWLDVTAEMQGLDMVVRQS